MKKQMNLLIVEGNIEATRVEREKFGVVPFHILFPEMLRKIDPTIQTMSVFPSDDDKYLPSLKQLKKYDGVMWTGSALHILDKTPEVSRQLNFAETVFKSGVPFYGSCWGMQVATVAAGGKVARNPKGIEVGVTEPIQLTDAGKKSPFFFNRKDNFKALCIHLDEVVKLPENTLVLAKNSHSDVQAMTFDYKKSIFFGVQYHPEFTTKDLAFIISFLAKDLVRAKSYTSIKEVDNLAKKLIDKNDLPIEVADYNLHIQEIKAWLNFI